MGDTTQRDNAYIQVTFSPDPGLVLLFDGLTMHQELGRPFLLEIELSCTKLEADVRRVVGAVAKVKLLQATGTTRYLNGIVTRIVSSGLSAGAFRYRIEVRPWVWLLSRINDCKIFQKKSPFQIITGIFRDKGFSDFKDKRQNGSGDIVLDYCVQYRETSLDFVTRLMERYGIYYYFEHDESTHTLVLADDPNSHTTLTDEIPFQFDKTELRTVDDHFWEWSTDLGLYSGKYTHRDYNFTTPSADLTAKTVEQAGHPHDDFEVYDYPGPFETSGDGQTLADVRMQAIAADRKICRAVSNSRLLHAGWKFKLSEYPDKPANREYLITHAQITVSISEGQSAQSGGADQEENKTTDTYRVTIHAIPSDTHYRLHSVTPRPAIRGLQTACVVGAAGDEVTTDEYGRIKVRFHWDRSETQNDECSCWIRVAQNWGGGSWGSLILPRVGQEVVVEFLEGNPDRPLVTGVVYNATNQVPYKLPDNKTQSGFKTNSSPGGSGFNEFRFEDKAGEEEVFFQAQKDYNKKVLNNETVSVKNDHKTTIESGNRSVTVSSGNDSKTVSAGNHSVDVSAGKSDITAAQSITLTCGGTSIKIEPSGVTITAPQVQVTANASMSLNGGGSMTLSAGMISIN